MGFDGVVVRPLDPPLHLELEVVWRQPARPTVRRLVDYLVEVSGDSRVLISPTI